MLNDNALSSHFLIGELLFFGQWAASVILRRQEKLTELVILVEARVPQVDTNFEFFKPPFSRRKVLFKHAVILTFPNVTIAQKQYLSIVFRVPKSRNHRRFNDVPFFLPEKWSLCESSSNGRWIGCSSPSMSSVSYSLKCSSKSSTLLNSRTGVKPRPLSIDCKILNPVSLFRKALDPSMPVISPSRSLVSRHGPPRGFKS